MMLFPTHLRGDGPCVRCGTADNIVWFTDNVFWNAVTRNEVVGDEKYSVLCPRCFVTLADEAGFRPRGYRLIPEWPWAQEEQGAGSGNG